MKPTLLLAVFSAIAALTVGVALAREVGTALRNADIKFEPYRDAKSSGTLVKGDKMQIVKRQGGWYQVKSAKGSGWVRMLSVRRGEARRRSLDADSLIALASGRAGTGKVVATTGIRGLTEEELKNAKYNESELKKMESIVINQEDLRKFANAGKLVVRTVDYLPNPD